MQSRSAKHATDGGTSRRFFARFPKPRTSRKRRQGPILETLETRTLLSITVSGYSSSLGAVTFTGDGTGDVLTLSEVPSPDLPKSPIVLAYNENVHLDPAGDELVIGSGTKPMITVDFTAGGTNTLNLDTSWTYTHPVNMEGSGSDTLATYSAIPETWLIGAGNTGSTSNLTYSGVATLQGNTLDTLQGEDVVTATWSLSDTGPWTYSDGSTSLYFSDFANLQAGSGPNTFQVSGAAGSMFNVNLLGGAGDDAFCFDGTSKLTGNIDGGGGNSTLSYLAYDSGLEIALSSVSAYGYAGTESSSFDTGYGFTNISNLVGNTGLLQLGLGSQVDGIPGDNATWTVGGALDMSYQDTSVDGAPTLNIFDVTDLMGSTGNDTFNITASTPVNLHGNTGTNDFVFSDGAILTGSIDGNDGLGDAGTNTLDLSQYSTAVTVTLDTSTSSTVGGTTSGTVNPISSGRFDDIDTILAGTHEGVTNTLVGENADRTWNLATASSTYGDGTTTFLTFSGFGQVTGGTGADTFVFANNAIFDGSIDGGTGSNTLDLSAYTTAVTVTLDTSTSSTVGGTTSSTGTDPDPISGRFDDIGTIEAGTPSSGTNVLVGENAARTWDLNTTQTYGDGTTTFGLDGLRGCLSACAVDVIDGHCRAGPGEPQGDLLTDACAGPCDQRHRTVE